MAAHRRPWQEWLTPGQYARLFPGGQADLEAFYDRTDEREKVYGIPAECHDPDVYFRVAEIAAEPATRGAGAVPPVAAAAGAQ